MSYEIDDDACIACGLCAKNCPAGAASGEIKVSFEIDPTLCDECGTCFDNCPKAAILDSEGKRRPPGKKRKRKKSSIDPDVCAGCQTCFLNCPQEAVSFIKKNGLLGGGYCLVNVKLCIGCGICTEFCITGAVSLE